MKAVVIGYGSIGQRHSRILKELKHEVTVVSLRDVPFKPSCRVLGEALSQKPDYVVIANETVKHFETLKELASHGFSGTALVEKPLFLKNERTDVSNFKTVRVAYNLRFHPVIRRLKELLAAEKVLSVQAYVGRYLPEWRPSTDYRSEYSARKSSGGGVLRDLSHELDYLNWIFGGWSAVTALGGHFSHLEIDSDDIYGLMIVFQKCPLAIVQMNYLDRISRREILINSDKHTFKVDLIAGTLEVDGNVERLNCEKDDTYRWEHEAVSAGRVEELCSYEEAVDVLRLIEAAEKAAEQKIWVKR